MDKLKKLEELIGLIEEAYAIELLQYRNKNHLLLGGDPKRLSEQMQGLLKMARSRAFDLSGMLRDKNDPSSRSNCSDCGISGQAD